MKRHLFGSVKVLGLSLIIGCLFFVQAIGAGAEPYKTTARVNIRQSASTNADILKTVDSGTVVDVASYDAAGWSKISLSGLQGYIKSEYLSKTAAASTATTASTTSYKTNDRVNLRKSASTDSAILSTLNSGTAVTMISYDAKGWSKVKAGGTEGYIKSEYLTASTPASTATATATTTAATAASTTTYKTNTRVNLRKSASTDSAILSTLNSGAAVTMISYDAKGWSKVKVNGAEGYIKSEYLTASASASTATATSAAAATTSETYRTSTRVNLRKSASTDSAILSTLNAGTVVTMISYDAKNWSKVKVNGSEGYIKSEYVTTGSVTAASSVELLDWSEVKTIFKTYTPAKVYDVRSGKVYYVQSFSNGSHADVETLTKEDTAIMKETFGGVWSWAVRPVWVTINGHTIAGSINGQPHATGTISGNNMDGQVCIHFRGSTTHNGNTSFAAEHQRGVTEAWNAAQ